MRQHGIRGKQTKRYKRTTQANPDHAVAPNLLDGDFSAAAPHQKWTTDMTYIATAEGWLYLAVVLNLFSRRVVGWAMAGRMTSALVLAALQTAIQQRQPSPGLRHHSDRGSQYTGQPYQQLLKACQMQVSMSGVGNCYDNAPTESFFSSLKTEWVDHRQYATRAQAKTDLFFYIEGFYNQRRRHSTLGYLSPAAYEQLHHQQQRGTALTLCP